MTAKELQQLRRDITRSGNHVTCWKKRLIIFIEENDLDILTYVYGSYIRFADLATDLIVSDLDTIEYLENGKSVEKYWSPTENKFMSENEIKEHLKLMDCGTFYGD